MVRELCVINLFLSLSILLLNYAHIYLHSYHTLSISQAISMVGGQRKHIDLQQQNIYSPSERLNGFHMEEYNDFVDRDMHVVKTFRSRKSTMSFLLLFSRVYKNLATLTHSPRSHSDPPLTLRSGSPSYPSTVVEAKSIVKQKIV